MYGPYVREIFISILNERCRIFLIKKTMPLLPTLGRYKDAKALLADLKKGNHDWYKQFLDEMLSTLPKAENYKSVDLSTLYRFAAFVAKNIGKSNFSIKWSNATALQALEDDKTKSGKTTNGDAALYEWFVLNLDLILKQSFSGELGAYKSPSDYNTMYQPQWAINDLNFYYAPSLCGRAPPITLLQPQSSNPCCVYADYKWDNPPIADKLTGNIFVEKDPYAPTNLYYLMALMFNALNTSYGGWSGMTKHGKFKAAAEQLTPADRCYICRRTSGYLQDPDEVFSLLSWIEDDITELCVGKSCLNHDEELAGLTRFYLNCEEFGMPTFRHPDLVYFNDLNLSGPCGNNPATQNCNRKEAVAKLHDYTVGLVDAELPTKWTNKLQEVDGHKLFDKAKGAWGCKK